MHKRDKNGKLTLYETKFVICISNEKPFCFESAKAKQEILKRSETQMGICLCKLIFTVKKKKTWEIFQFDDLKKLSRDEIVRYPDQETQRFEGIKD